MLHAPTPLSVVPIRYKASVGLRTGFHMVTNKEDRFLRWQPKPSPPVIQTVA
jgi:hypothetical protein